MTGPEYVEQQMVKLRQMAAEADDPAALAALGFALANLHVGPVSVASIAEMRSARRLSDTMFNYLGTRDADEVADWIINARMELALSRERVP